MSCDCLVNNSLFLYDLLNTNIDKINFNYDLSEYIEDFQSQSSGVWLPAFFTDTPVGLDGKNWTRVTKGRALENPPPGCEDTTTPNGLGLADFITVDQPEIRNWNIVGDCRLKVDWIINFQQCKQYDECILFWYRYYDIDREDDLRLIPGVDIFISDGDFASISDEPEVTSNLSSTANGIYVKLLNSGYDETDAELFAKILSSGPQIDNITDSLYYDPNNLYDKDDFGRIISFLKGMSIKTYSDIGKNNFITSKYDLLQKLIQKYGGMLEIPENSKAEFVSKFWSETGPNIEIKLDGDLYRANPKVYSGYNIGIKVGDLELIAKKSNENFIPKKYDSESKQVISANTHSINYFTLNNQILNYNLIDNTSGIFNPDLSTIRFHGLGGVDFETTSLFGDSCVNGVTIYKDQQTNIKKALYQNTVVNDGPFFITDSKFPSSVNTIEKTRSQIQLNVETATNSKFVFNNQIVVSYLRSDTHPTCEPFVKNQDTCKCYNLGRLHPTASGSGMSNEKHLIFTPNTSLYYVPSGYFYGGLTTAEVSAYGTILPDHPVPGTRIPQTHNKPFPEDQSCSLSMDGCGSQNFKFYMPYPGKVLLKYQSTKGVFRISDGQNSANSPPGTDGTIFTGTAGTICIDKIDAYPTGVDISIGVPKDQPDTQWGVTISGIQNKYTEQIPNGEGLVLKGEKGFFHPNFGWTFNKKYHNFSPVIPNHRKIVPRQVRVQSDTYKITIRYDDVYPGDGPNCAGGHGCNSAKFDVYANDTYIGTANLNNAGGPEDPGPPDTGDRIAVFDVPTSIGLINGNQINLFIKCAYKEGCHGGVANVSIQNSKGEYLYRACLATDVVVPITLDTFSLPFYNYNAYAMYNSDNGPDYLPGYNYLFNFNEYPEYILNNFLRSSYIGIKTAANSFYVTKNFQKIQYVPSQSLILESVPFQFVNFDTINSYGANDFKFKKLSNNTMVIDSEIEGADRAIAYTDSINYNTSDQFFIYSDKDTNESLNAKLTNSNKNTIQINKSLSSPLYDSGFIARDHGEDASQSIVIYSPNFTFNDYITTGKWGNHSYSEAIYEFYKYLSKDEQLNANNLNHLYNNSFLREKYSSNTSFSWGAPITFYNDFDTDNPTHYFPVSRLLNTYKNSTREIHTVGLENQYASAVPDGDRIIASGTLPATSIASIYVGSYIGPLTIKIRLDSISSGTLGTLRLLHNNEKLQELNLSSHNNNIITFNINKDNHLSRYAKVELNYIARKCSDPIIVDVKPKLASYSVKLNNSSQELRQRSRISYYGHKNTKLINKKYSFANNFDRTAIQTIDGQVVAPLSENNQSIQDKRLDYGAYLDMHIFSKDAADKPITSNVGSLFFDDFLQPKSYNYLKNMELPYDDQIYWIDIPENNNWSILTSKGILLESSATYKVLKSLKYTCKDNAKTCAGRYPTNICDYNYTLSEGELFDLLGLSGEDRDLLNITTVSFPSYCSAIDYCCSRFGTSGANYQNCIDRQNQARTACKDYWTKTVLKNVNCVSEPCPSGSMSGSISTNAEYFIINIKNDIYPNLKTLNKPDFHFFTGENTASIPCTTETFPSVGTSYKYSFNCTDIDTKCDSIIPKDFTISSSYVPGEMLDLSSLVRRQSLDANPTPSSIIFSNEITYRETFDHRNKIALPLEEYDFLAESKYLTSYTFNIKSKKCTNGELATINIDNISCTFWAQPTTSGTILISTCFPDKMLKTVPSNENTITISKTICPEKHSCKLDYCYTDDQSCYYPSVVNCEKEDWSCGDAADYLLKTYGEDAELTACQETSHPEDYYLDCRLCDKTLVNEDGEPCTANYWSVTLNYKTPVQPQCFCPEWAKLNETTKQCEYDYDVLVCTDYCKEGTVQTVKGYVAASCSQPGYEPTEAQLKAYNEACGTENVRSSKEYSVLWTHELAPETKNRELELAYAKDFNRIYVASCAINNEATACNGKCFQTYNDCINKSSSPDCYKAYSACSCQCSKKSSEANAKLEASRTLYYYCSDNCGWSDSISSNWYYWYGYGYNNCFGYYWWWGGWNTGGCPQDPLYGQTSLSYNRYDYSKGKYIRDCAFTGCKDTEKRIQPNRFISNTECSCVTDYYGYTQLQCTGECQKMKVSDLGAETTTYKSHVVTHDIVTKTKRPPVTKFKDRESKYSNVKIYSKTFQLKWKSKKDSEKSFDCDPKCKDNQVCCPPDNPSSKVGTCKDDCCVDKVDLDFTVTFDLYSNIIIGTLSGVSNKLCAPRNNNTTFSCPKVSYSIVNPDVSICDSVTSNCYNCDIGGIT